MVAIVIAVVAAAVALVALVWQWITRREIRSLRERRPGRPAEPGRSVERAGRVGSQAVASEGVGGASTETLASARGPREVRVEPPALLVESAGAREAPATEPHGGERGMTEAAFEPPVEQGRPAGRSEAAVLDLLDDDRPDVRRSAVAALAAGGGAHALRGLSYAAARDPAVEVRREAILGLRSLVERRSAPTEGGAS